MADGVFGGSNPFAGMSGQGLWYLNEQPEAGFGKYVGGGNDAFSRWLRSQYGRYQSDYSGKLANTPSMQWTDYLSSLNPKGEYAQLGAWDRGESPRNWSGRTRWVW